MVKCFTFFWYQTQMHTSCSYYLAFFCFFFCLTVFHSSVLTHACMLLPVLQVSRGRLFTVWKRQLGSWRSTCVTLSAVPTTTKPAATRTPVRPCQCNSHSHLQRRSTHTHTHTRRLTCTCTCMHTPVHRRRSRATEESIFIFFLSKRPLLLSTRSNCLNHSGTSIVPLCFCRHLHCSQTLCSYILNLAVIKAELCGASLC